MPQRHSRNLRRIRMDIGGNRNHARPRPHVRHRLPTDRPSRNSENSQINQRSPHIHPIPRAQRAKILGKRPMVAINLLRERRTYQRRHRQKIHSNPKGKSLEPDGDSFPPTRGGESSPITSLEGRTKGVRKATQTPACTWLFKHQSPPRCLKSHGQLNLTWPFVHLSVEPTATNAKPPRTHPH